MKAYYLMVGIGVCAVLNSCIDQSSERKYVKSGSEDSTSYTITKTLAVSPEKVYAAYLDPQSLKQIWGVDSINIDAKPEGRTHGYLKLNDENRDFTLTYKEVIPNQKLKWVMNFDKHPKLEIWTTIVFNSIKEGTEISFCQENFKTRAERDENRNTNTEALNKLSSLLIKL